MSHNKYFQFKQFRIEQHHAAMKVNTDGVLLGAWTDVEGVNTVLDIGTGTGLIALMIAQRCNATITGIEIENKAAEEAFQNVQQSKWNDRISILPVSFQQFVATTELRFDLIVSNPPFFSNSEKSRNHDLSVARHNDLLPFADIIDGVCKLLTNQGCLSLILPSSEAPGFIALAQKQGLNLHRVIGVKPFPDKEQNRVLMEFGRRELPVIENEISVYNHSRKEYSAEFKILVSDFYLKL
ncbi:MAG: tRNA1(Val) (adenine(37)-N6)-methyltransferase [Draconibacterium sp.]